MNIETYQSRRRALEESAPKFRELCLRCMQPEFGCYCSHVKTFDSKIRFVILIHPIEMRRRIATGRMSHLTLANSHLILGQDYSYNQEVNEILNDPKVHSVMLYPGVQSADLSKMDAAERAEHFPKDKELAVFVIDGTWATARKMVRSTNLAKLPRVCFSPSTPSRFRVRKQPMEGCYSTIEAIHQTIELVGDGQGFATKSRQHDQLLEVFDVMVERQLACIQEMRANRHQTYRRENQPSV